MMEKDAQNMEKKRNRGNDFTGMPNEEPFPDFEPRQSRSKQVEQFEDTADNGKKNSST